jgi:hypothetical protein
MAQIELLLTPLEDVIAAESKPAAGATKVATARKSKSTVIEEA